MSFNRSLQTVMASLYFAIGICLIYLHESSASISDLHPVLLVSLDGLGWQFTGGNFANTENLDYIASIGVKADYMITITPTKTWPTHQTYLTGLYAENHGIISNNFYDPLYEEKFILQYDCSNFDPKFYNESEPIWLTLQKRGGKSGVHYWPGFYSYPQKPSFTEKPTCFVNCSAISSKDLPRYRNKTRAGWPPYIHCFANQSMPYKNRVDQVLGWLKADKPPKFLALYINEPDSSGHSYGISTGHFKRAIEKVDKDVLGYLIRSLRQASLFDKVNLIIVSDHSMIETSSSKEIFLSDFVNPSTFVMSEQGVIGHVWPNPGMEDEIYDNFTRANHPKMTVYRKRDIPANLHWKNNRRVPPIYVEPRIGWSVKQSRPARASNWTSAGHGWVATKDLGAIFYAHGPAFKRGYKAKQVLQAVDVYPLMCHLLGIEPLPNNGSLENMKELLIGNPPSSKGAHADGVINLFTALSLLFVLAFHLYLV